MARRGTVINTISIVNDVRRKIGESIFALRKTGGLHSEKMRRVGWRVRAEEQAKQVYVLTDFEGFEFAADYWYPVARQIADALQTEFRDRLVTAMSGQTVDFEKAIRVTTNVLIREVLRQLDQPAGPNGSVERDLAAASNDLNGIANDLYAELHLWGIRLSTGPITFTFANTDCVLRSVTAEELSAPSMSVEFPMTPYLATVLLEMRQPHSYFSSHQLRVPHIIAMLQVFGVGGVRVVREFVRTSSLLDFCAFGPWSTFGEPRRIPSFYSYEIDVPRAKQLTQFALELAPLLTKHLPSLDAPPSTPWSIAYTRYVSAITSVADTAQRTTLAIMCLEALLSEKANSWRLAARVAGLLSCIGENANAIFALVRKGYDVRNKYVHGEIEAEAASSNASARARTDQLLDICRKSLVITLARQFVIQSDKNRLLSLIDCHLLGLCDNSLLLQQLRPVDWVS